MKLTSQDMTYIFDYLDVKMHAPRYEEVVKAMERYDTPWWREHRGDPIALTNCQIDEEILLIRKSDFIKGVSMVMGRSIIEDELHSWNKELIAEFHEKYEKLGKS